LSRQSREERAMANIIDLRSKRSDRRRRQPLIISASIVLLAAVVLIYAGLIAVPLWTALFQDWRAEAISDP